MGGAHETIDIDVSVVVPVFEAAATLPDCLRSLLGQSLPRHRYEVIVVDNGSEDGSDGLAKQTPGVSFVRESRPGAYAARNAGIRCARGRFVAFTDPDCVPAEDWLEAALAALTDGSQVVLGETMPFGRGFAGDVLAAYQRARDEYVFAGEDTTRYYGRTNNMVVARAALDGVGLFTETQRGADTMFVRAAVERFGPQSVRYDHRMRVRHAELTTVRDQHRKTHIYGYVHELQHAGVPIRGLGVREWLHLLRVTRRRTDHPGAVPVLAALTAASAAAWRLGRWRAALGLPAPRGTFRRRISPPDRARPRRAGR